MPAAETGRFAVFCDMNHAGVLLSVLYCLLLAGSVALVGELRAGGSGEGGGYVCPPCGCSQHGRVLPGPGACEGCGMPLIPASRGRNRAFEAIFESSETNFYHHKLFYPVNFLAIFLGASAFFRFRRELPMVFFFVFFGSFVLYSFKNQLYGTEYSMHATAKWAFFPASFLLAAGPALFFYFSTARSAEARFSRRDLLHFLPAGIVHGLHTALFLGPETWRQAAFYNNYDHFPGLAEQLAFVASGSYYSILTARAGREGAPGRFGRGLLTFLMTAIGVMAVMVFGNFHFFDLMSTWLDYHPLWLCIAAFTLWSSYFLVFKKEVIFQPLKNLPKETRLPNGKIMAAKAALEAAMASQRPYRNPDLTLQMLAQSVGLKEKDLSEVLNNGCGKSFYDFVNFYRIEEVKTALLDADKQHLTNFAIAQESGFNSKSAFFGLFKKHVGTTPGEFKKRNGVGWKSTGLQSEENGRGIQK